MKCREYIAGFLSADADDELDASERRLVDDHLGGCAACRARLANERAMKALIRRHSPLAKAPADVRLRIRAALGEMNDRPADSRRGANSMRAAGMTRALEAKTPGRFARVLGSRRRLYVAAPALAALSIALIVALSSGGARPPAPAAQRLAVPEFDLAIGKFGQMAGDFTPNVPVEAFNSNDGAYYAWVVSQDTAKQAPDDRLDLVHSYSELGMPSDLYDFDSSGYALAGGRFDHLADGRAVTYTLYRGHDGALMNICIRNPRMAIPLGAMYWVGMHSFYRYKDYSLCVTFDPTARFVSIVVSRQPIIDLVRDVTLADIEAAGQ
jgi:anti-sigma factor RsiW